MKRAFTIWFLVFFFSLPAGAQNNGILPDKELLPPMTNDDPYVEEVLRKTDAISAYEVPELRLKRETNYAKTPWTLEPFRAVKPFKEHFLEQMEYTGPGRAAPEPENLESVKLGFIGPIESTVSVATGGRSHEEPLGKQMLRGARLAIEQANARGGYLKRGIPFQLVVSNDNGLWGASGNEIIKMAYKDRVWAILGTIDGANSHIAIRTALKAELPMMNSGNTDPTFIETNIPWVFRCISDDRQMGYLLVDYLYRKLGYGKVGLIRSSNRYGRFGVREVLDASRRLGKPIALEMAYHLGTSDFSLQLERLRESKVEAVVHWGDAEEGARILNQMRELGMRQPYFGCDRHVSTEFVKLAGSNAEGSMFVYPWNPKRRDPKLSAFRRIFKKRFGIESDTYAAHGYDGMNMLLWAVQVAGLNRARIRDVLAYRSKPWPGVTGDIALSAALDDVGEISLAKFEGGRWNFLTPEELDITQAHYQHREHLSEYHGPGREDPEPVGLKSVALGYFGPSELDHPLGGDAWLAAKMAIEKANSEGGFRGLPFRLVPGWSENRWGTGVSQLARMVYQDSVWAVIGSIDGPSTHLAEQVAVKARVTLLNPASSDKSVNLANVPWMFSCLPGEHLQIPVLYQALKSRIAAQDFILVSGTDHDSRMLTGEFTRYLSLKDRAPAYHFAFDSKAAGSLDFVSDLIEARPAAVVVLAGAEDSVRIVKALREGSYNGPLFGGPAMGQRLFLENAGDASKDLYFPLLTGVDQETGFASEFRRRSGHNPDYVAGQTYDAVQLLVRAIRKAGLNRARIRDAVRELSPWQGMSGAIEWDNLGQNRRSVRLATVRRGVVAEAPGSVHPDDVLD